MGNQLRVKFVDNRHVVGRKRGLRLNVMSWSDSGPNIGKNGMRTADGAIVASLTIVICRVFQLIERSAAIIARPAVFVGYQSN